VVILPNELAHLPPVIAGQLTLETTFSTKWPPRTRAEGGQVEPVLGGTVFEVSLVANYHESALCFFTLLNSINLMMRLTIPMIQPMG